MRYSTRIGLRTGILFGLFFGLMGLINGPVGVLIGIVLGGGSFGLFVGWLMRRKERVWAMLREPYEAEGIVQQGPASCAIGPGYLLLTTKRLVWLPYISRDRGKKILIAREAISNIKKDGFGANVRVEVYTGESAHFLVSDRRKWLEELKAIVAAAPPKAVARIRETPPAARTPTA